MKITSHSGEYNRVLKHIRALKKEHIGLSSYHASKLSMRLPGLLQAKKAIEKCCGEKISTPYVPKALPWKEKVTKRQERKRGLLSVLFSLFSRPYNRFMKGWAKP